MASNLPPGLTARDLDHIYGPAVEPICICGHTLDEHDCDVMMPCAVEGCGCTAWEEDFDE